MLKTILQQLKSHSPFTLFGALTGIVIMFFFRDMSHDSAYQVFYVLHPAHVLLSALVTSSMYQLHRRERRDGRHPLWTVLAIGYAGSVGMATVSDSLIPYLCETVLDLPLREAHVGFIEEFLLVNLAAVLGIGAALWRPTTKLPHALHVFVSTWASLFHIVMALGGAAALAWWSYPVVFAFLFVAVWLPCCFGDIVFPLLFVGKDAVRPCCGGH